LGLIGQGQYGKVYCATHRKSGRLVALKLLDQQRFPTHQFLRELRFLLSLRHPNIVACNSIEHVARGRCLVMDYCEGGTLRHLLESGARPSIRQSCQLVSQILAGLAHAQSQTIIHCDIKPENILLTLKPQGWVAHISDFGIARVSQDLRIGTGTTGSPAYMAPERFYGQYNFTADLYAVGIILFELLVGKRPFSGPPMDLMTAHLNQLPTIPSNLPTPLQPILRKALEKLPARRFQLATEMSEALDQAMADLQTKSVQLHQRLFLHLPDFVQFKAAWQEHLTAPITQLAWTQADSPLRQPSSPNLERLYYSSYDFVQCATYEQGLLHGKQTGPKIRQTFEQGICRLITTPDKDCFVVTPQEIYQWFWQLNQVETGDDSPLLANPTQCLRTFVDPVQVAISPDGQWFAAASHPLGTAQVQIFVGRWRSLQGTRGSSRDSSRDSSYGSKPILCRSPSLSQLFILDRCHGLALCHEPDHSCFELFNRRGQGLGVLPLDLNLEYCVLGNFPYQLIGLEVGAKDCLLVINLKPFQIKRLAVPIAPVLCQALDWGYVVADAQAQLVLLDQDGEILGQVQAPPSSLPLSLTGLSTFQGHGVLLATWQQDQGTLYGIDLRQLNVNILF
jgi:serine/threonine-protein kinase